MILPLPHNPIPVYYSGGSDIRRYRGIDDDSLPLSPEDWIGSTTIGGSRKTDSSGDPVGYSRVADGRTVSALISADPATWLGSDVSDRTADFLLKLLNPGMRIPVHWHPDDGYASKHLGLSNGKAEAWIILSDTATVWLGFAEGTTESDLRAAIDRQDPDWMLDRMHRFDLAYNDTVFVPPGLVHAIGAGALLAEIQEPSSASILAEHASLGLDAERAHLGAGWDAAFECLLRPSPRDQVLPLLGIVQDAPGTSPVFPEASRRFFGASVINVSGVTAVPIHRLSAAIVDQGPVTWADESTGDRTSAAAGSSWLLGAGLGSWSLEGDGRVFLFSGPA